MKWDPGLGLWSLLDTPRLQLYGATPRHADLWRVAVKSGRFFLELSVEYRFVYASAELWWGRHVRHCVLGRHRMHRKFSAQYFGSCSCQTGMFSEAGRKKS